MLGMRETTGNGMARSTAWRAIGVLVDHDANLLFFVTGPVMEAGARRGRRGRSTTLAP